MADRITYAGLDVHKESIVVAVAAPSSSDGKMTSVRLGRRRSHDGFTVGDGYGALSEPLRTVQILAARLSECRSR